MFTEWTLSTPIFNLPVLRYPAVGSYGPFEIRLIIQDYKPTSRKNKFNPIQSVPIVDIGSNLAYNGNFLENSTGELPKFTVGGYMETPVTSVGGYMLPAFVRENNRMTYGDFIAATLEGRAGLSNTAQSRLDPSFFRDPYGRVFNNPIIANFTSSFVEGVPGRQTFNMTIIATTGTSLSTLTSL